MLYKDLFSKKEIKEGINLYKAWILGLENNLIVKDPEEKRDILRLDVNTAGERYALNIKSAVEISLNNYSSEELKDKLLTRLVNYTHNIDNPILYIIIFKITLDKDIEDDEIYYKTENGELVILDPNYDKEAATLSVTVPDISHVIEKNGSIEVYAITKIDLDIDNNKIVHINDIKYEKVE